MEHLTILHWFTKYSFVCIPVLAFLLDLLIGDPNSKYHPVAIIGRIISFFEAVLYKDTDNDTKKIMVRWYCGWLNPRFCIYCSVFNTMAWWRC